MISKNGKISLVSSLKKSINRLGKEKHRVHFSIQVKNVVISNEMNSIKSSISVCFERGGRSSSTQEKLSYLFKSNESTGLTTIDINESLSLLVTLYYDKKSDQYQEKNGFIVLRELINKSKNHQIHNGLGLCKINLTGMLSDIFNGENSSVAGKDICFPLENKPNCFINGSINAKYIGNIEDDDDDQSILSTYSGQSIMCADFNNNIDSLLSISEESEEESKEDYCCNKEANEIQNLTKLDLENHIKIDSRSSPIDQIIKNCNIISPDKSYTSTNINPIFSRINSPNNNKSPFRSLSTEYLLEKYPLLSRKLSEKDSGLVDDLQAQLILYEKYLESKENTIEKLTQDIEIQDESYKIQILGLKSEVNELSYRLKVENIGKRAIENANNLADESLAQLLANQREESELIQQEYAFASSQIQMLEEELKIQKLITIKALESRDEEKDAALNAAAAVSTSALKRAELEAETDGLLNDLIEAKIYLATVTEENDDIKNKLLISQRRLKRYAERLGKLEAEKGLHLPSSPHSRYNKISPKKQ